MKQTKFTYPKRIIIHQGDISNFDTTTAETLAFNVYVEPRQIDERPVPTVEEFQTLISEWFAALLQDYHPYQRFSRQFGVKPLTAIQRDALHEIDMNPISTMPGFGPILMGQRIANCPVQITELCAFGTLLCELRNYMTENKGLVRELSYVGPGKPKVDYWAMSHLQSVAHEIQARRMIPPKTEIKIGFHDEVQGVAADVRGSTGFVITVGHYLAARVEIICTHRTRYRNVKDQIQLHLFGWSYDLLKNILTLAQIGTGPLKVYDCMKARQEYWDKSVDASAESSAAFVAELLELGLERERDFELAFKYIHNGEVVNE